MDGRLGARGDRGGGDPEGPPLRVAVDLLWLEPGVVGGSETAVVGMLTALVERAGPRRPRLRLVCDPRLPAAHPGLAAAGEVVCAPRLPGRKVTRVALETTWMRPRTGGADVVWYPGGTIPPGGRGPAVLTIHDLQYRTYPGTFVAPKRWWLRWRVPASVRAATAVTVPSRYVAGTVAAAVPDAAERIVVVPNPVSLPPDPGPVPVPVPTDRPWVVYPAVTYHHKNHAVLLEALALMPPRRRPRLVLCGRPGPAEDHLGDLIRRLGLLGDVVRPGRLPAEVLDRLLRDAAAVAVPSRYEGFGYAAAEGLIRGRPVIAAAATALPEVVGDAGLLCDPDDPACWADAIGRVLDDPGLARELGARGVRRMAAYAPAVVADQLLEVLAGAAGR